MYADVTPIMFGLDYLTSETNSLDLLENRLPEIKPTSPPRGGDGAHLALSVYILDSIDTSMCIIATKTLGWDVSYRGTVGRGEVYIPDVGFIPHDGNYTTMS